MEQKTFAPIITEENFKEILKTLKSEALSESTNVDRSILLDLRYQILEIIADSFDQVNEKLESKGENKLYWLASPFGVNGNVTHFPLDIEILQYGDNAARELTFDAQTIMNERKLVSGPINRDEPGIHSLIKRFAYVVFNVEI